MNLVFKKDDMQSTLRKGLGLTLRGLKEQRKIIPARIANERAVAASRAIGAGRKGKLVAKRSLLPELRRLKRQGLAKTGSIKRRIKKV